MVSSDEIYTKDATTLRWVSPGRAPQTPPPPPGGTALVHPGAGYSDAMLTQMANDVAVSTSTRAAAYNRVLAQKTNYSGTHAQGSITYGDPTWVPHPLATVYRGASGGAVNSGGDQDLLSDGTAALVQALAWRITGDRARASNSCSILNAWSSTMTAILMDATSTHSDGKLLSGWTGTMLARAGEIMAYSGWNPSGSEVPLQKTQLQNMLKAVYINATPPAGITTQWGGAGANWHASMADSYIQIGVFCDDNTIYTNGLAFYRANLHSIFWMPGDHNKWSQLSSSTPPTGGLPESMPNTQYDRSACPAGTYPPPDGVTNSMRYYWYDPISFPAGLQNEIGRDSNHTAMSYSATTNACETARIQGDDLYGEEKNRIVTSCELQTKFIYDVQVSGTNPPPSWPFNTNSRTPGYGFAKGQMGFIATAHQRCTWEGLYNHYVGRTSPPASMPNTLALLNAHTRTSTFKTDLHAVGEELTFRANTA